MNLLQCYQELCATDAEPPDLSTFLSTFDVDKLASSELTALVRFDQERQWISGARPDVEVYLAAIPRLAHDAEFIREMVVCEIRLRKRFREDPKLEEYIQRFPVLAEQLRSVFEATETIGALDVAPVAIERESEASEEESSQVATSNHATHAQHEVSLDSPRGSVVDSEIEAGSILGAYQIVKKLGGGTFGIVYQAQHRATGAMVAIKVLKSQWADDRDVGLAMRTQFVDEANAMMRFNHPRVVQMIAMEAAADPPFFVQQFIDGQTLKDRLGASRLEILESLRYAIQIADGLTHIHSFGLWHRDLKPANVLLDQNDEVYLADFGLALDDAQRWGARGKVEGTWAYMAPEQIHGATHLINARCDLWALGVILYEMLTNKRPFDARNRQQLCDEILQRTPPAPRDFDERIPKSLNQLCMQCLAKRDSDRPASAADVRDDLIAIQEELVALQYSDSKLTGLISPNPASDLRQPSKPKSLTASFTAGSRSCSFTFVMFVLLFAMFLVVVKVGWSEIRSFFNDNVAEATDGWSDDSNDASGW